MSSQSCQYVPSLCYIIFYLSSCMPALYLSTSVAVSSFPSYQIHQTACQQFTVLVDCDARWSDILVPTFWRNLLPPSSGLSSQIWAIIDWNVGAFLPDSTVLSQKTEMSFICCYVSLILKPYKVWRFRSSQVWHSVNGQEGPGTLYSYSAFILRVRQSKIVLFGLFDPVDEGSVILQNAWNFSPTDVLSCPRRLEPSATVLQDRDIWRCTKSCLWLGKSFDCFTGQSFNYIQVRYLLDFRSWFRQHLVKTKELSSWNGTDSGRSIWWKAAPWSGRVREGSIEPFTTATLWHHI